MAIEIKLPDIGSDEVDVTEILVKAGDRVELEQPLVTVEGDKASMEVPSPQAGVVKEIKIKVGTKVTTGSLIMLFEGETSSSSTAQQQSAASQVPTEKQISAQQTSAIKEVNVPDIGTDEVEVTELLVKVGDNVVAEQSIMTIEGDKASMEIPAPFAGQVQEIKVSVGDKVKTNSLIMLFTIREIAAQPTTSASLSLAHSTAEQTVSHAIAKASNITKENNVQAVQSNNFIENNAYVHATPLVRRLAREFGVDLAKISGTGRKGRILREDIQQYVKRALQRTEVNEPSGHSTMPGILPWPKVDFSKFGTVEEIELGRIQKLSGANLYRNWVTIPHITQFDEADITELEAFRKQQNVEAEKQKRDVKITPLVFIMKAVAKSLEQFPKFNSSLSEDGQKLILKKYINVGVAVDTPNGLVVPVLRDVNKKGILELSKELMEISQKARTGKLTSNDMQGGCFTISSLGGIGGTAFTPIVNAPEVAILGVSKSVMRPVWNGKEFIPRLMLPLSLSYDHRVIDGADGARFITFMNAIMADIRRLIM